jgi:hypothetical protein
LESLHADIDEEGAMFGSLMSNGKRDKFGRDLHMKVCHLDTLKYNRDVAEVHPASMQANTFPDDAAEALLPSESQELLLRRKREEELQHIREVLRSGSQGSPTSVSMPVSDNAISLSDDMSSVHPASCSRQWRAIENHENRWQFLEETCFFGHNMGFKKIKKLYPRDEILRSTSAVAIDDLNATSHPLEDESGFGATEYIRKYMVSNNGENYITHEADPVFHKPLENFLGFLCKEEDEQFTVTVPFYVLPFPSSFTALSLDDHVNAQQALVLALEGDPDVHRCQRVSDYSLPTGNSFLNDPISYNKLIANVSLPVKLTV